MPAAAIAYPQVALDFMNRDHAEFVALLGRIDQALATGTPADALLDELMTHTRHHFAEEEAAMREAGFPAYPIHQGEHERVLGLLAERLAAWRSQPDADALRTWLAADVTDWFTGHVSSMDMVTAGFIAARGGNR